MERNERACLWLRVSTDTKGQNPKLQRTDLLRVCEQRHWQVVQTYGVKESTFGKKPRQQFQAMLEDARRGKFDVLVVWSLDRFSREGGWSVSRIIATLREWGVRFYSFSEEFLDTTGPFSEFMIPLFAWLAHQESVRKDKAVKLGIEKAIAKGRLIGRPIVVDSVDAELVMRLRTEGKSWREVAEAHPRVKSSSGKKVRPSVGSVRRVYAAWKAETEDGVVDAAPRAAEDESHEAR